VKARSGSKRNNFKLANKDSELALGSLSIPDSV